MNFQREGSSSINKISDLFFEWGVDPSHSSYFILFFYL